MFHLLALVLLDLSSAPDLFIFIPTMQLSSERERIQEHLYSLAKENEKLRVNQCSEGNNYQRNGTYGGDKELPSNTDGGGRIEAFAESLQAGG